MACIQKNRRRPRLWDRLQPGRRQASRCKTDGAHSGPFPAEAGPTNRWHASKKTGGDLDCGTGFSREGVRRHAAKPMVLTRASSRLKPVPLIDCMHPKNRRRPRLWDRLQPGKRQASRCKTDGAHWGPFPAEAGPTNRSHASRKTGGDLDCGTGFSREGVRRHAAKLMALTGAPSRLKPVPLVSAHSRS